MQCYWNTIRFQKPLIWRCAASSELRRVDHDLLNLKNLLPKWQSTSDAVRRLVYLGFFIQEKY